MNQLVFQSMCSVVEKMVVFTIWFHTIFYVCLYIHILRLAVCWIYRIANLWIIQLETIFCCWVASFTLQNSSNNCYFQDSVFVANFFWLSSFLWQLNFGQNGLFTSFHPQFFDDNGPASGNLLVPLFLTVFGGALFCCNCQSVLLVFSSCVRIIGFLLFRG